MVETRNQDLLQIDRSGHVTKWIQDSRNAEVATNSEAARREPASEAGLISDLHGECLLLIGQLRALPRDDADVVDLNLEERAHLGSCYAKLNLWGDVLHQAKLETSLRIVPDLRQSILEALTKIGQALLKVFHAQSNSDSNSIDACLQTATTPLSVLLEKALHALPPPGEEPSCLLDEATADGDSSEEESEYGDLEGANSPGRSENVTSLLPALRFRTRLLMDLLPIIQQILISTEYGNRPRKRLQQVEFYVSEAAREWVRQIIDRFEQADNALADRLGEANRQRYDYLRRLKDEEESTADPPEELEKTKSQFRPLTTARDSGLGTSIITPVETPASVASHSSFVSSLADGTSRRVPKTPDGVARGEPFQCEICGQTLRTITNRAQWKIHVFADIKPYICTFNDCKDSLMVFPTRKLWAEHEFSKHRCHVSFTCYICSRSLDSDKLLLDHLQVEHERGDLSEIQAQEIARTARITQTQPIGEQRCPLCQKTGWLTQRAFVKHLGKHLESIALLALPAEEEFESENECQSSEEEDERRKLGQGDVYDDGAQGNDGAARVTSSTVGSGEDTARSFKPLTYNSDPLWPPAFEELTFSTGSGQGWSKWLDDLKEQELWGLEPWEDINTDNVIVEPLAANTVALTASQPEPTSAGVAMPPLPGSQTTSRLARQSMPRVWHVCPDCEMRFRERPSLIRHQASAHHNNSFFVCPKGGCNYYSIRKDAVRRHCRLRHKDEGLVLAGENQGIEAEKNAGE